MPEKTYPRLPSKEDLLDHIRNSAIRPGKRELARAFGLKGAERAALKDMLRELTDEGLIARKERRRFSAGAGTLPPVGVLEIREVDPEGDLVAAPASWSEETPPPLLRIAANASEGAGVGERVLAKIAGAETGLHPYVARVMRRLGKGERRMLGVYRAEDRGGRVEPVDKRYDRVYFIDAEDAHGAEDGELVEIERVRSDRGHRADRGSRDRARVAARLGDVSAPRSISLIAIHQHGLPTVFDEETLREAEAAEPLLSLKGREDLRDLPFITIDPADARDHDDAVYAHPDEAPDNPDGWVIWVAIADVAHYVTPGSALDRDAYKRGNSAYFPDRVVPMLPEALSGDLCSLHEGVDRPCLAVRMRFDARGERRDHVFVRGVMRSAASLTYEQAQAAADGRPDDAAGPLAEPVIAPLWAAYAALAAARDRRGPLLLDLPERRVELDAAGRVSSIRVRERLDAHRLIEECMIQANVSAAETLEVKRAELIYRVHEEPDGERIDALRETLQEIGFSLAKGARMTPDRLNQALAAAVKTGHAETVSMMVLRAQSQAYYHPENYGHFGLNLRRYAHFTSPIRRYADLIVHRALIGALGLGSDALSPAEKDRLTPIAEHISKTERLAMLAERDSNDRYLAAYLGEQLGAEFEGVVSGVQRFGLFVRLDETGADGLIPVGTLGDDYYRFDRDRGVLEGERYGRRFEIGQAVRVRLTEATPVTGGLIFSLLEAEPRSRPGGRKAPTRKLARKAAIKKAKAARKARRR